jgi:hypothetical protein
MVWIRNWHELTSANKCKYARIQWVTCPAGLITSIIAHTTNAEGPAMQTFAYCCWVLLESSQLRCRGEKAPIDDRVLKKLMVYKSFSPLKPFYNYLNYPHFQTRYSRLDSGQWWVIVIIILGFQWNQKVKAYLFRIKKLVFHLPRGGTSLMFVGLQSFQLFSLIR